MTDRRASERPPSGARHAARVAAISCFVMTPLGIVWALWLLLGLSQLTMDAADVAIFVVPGLAGVVLAGWRLFAGGALWEIAAAKSAVRAPPGLAALGGISMTTGALATAYCVWALVDGDWDHHAMLWAGPVILMGGATGWAGCANGALLLRARSQLRS